MNKAVLCQLNETEAQEFMMSYVILTKNDGAIVIDGGRPENMDLLKKCVGKRKIRAWILTHAHSDHISGFMSEMDKNSCADFDIEKIYFNFPPYSLIERKDVLDYNYLVEELDDCLPEFNRLLPKFSHKVHTPQRGDVLDIDGLKIEFLYTYREEYLELLLNNLMNDCSLVFKVTGEKRTALFLGDLGPDSGDILFNDAREKLKSDIVQMAHPRTHELFHGGVCGNRARNLPLARAGMALQRVRDSRISCRQGRYDKKRARQNVRSGADEEMDGYTGRKGALCHKRRIL